MFEIEITKLLGEARIISGGD